MVLCIKKQRPLIPETNLLFKKYLLKSLTFSRNYYNGSYHRRGSGIIKRKNSGYLNIRDTNHG